MEKVTPRAVLLVHITTFSAKYLKNGLAGEEGRPHRIQVHLSIFKFRQKVTSKKESNVRSGYLKVTHLIRRR